MKREDLRNKIISRNIEYIDVYNPNTHIIINDLNDIIKLLEVLSKNKFSIPYIYGLVLVKSCKTDIFCKNCDFIGFLKMKYQI